MIKTTDIPVVEFDTSMKCVEFTYVPMSDIFKQIYHQNNWQAKKLNNYNYLIPKIIHIIWMGGALPDKYKRLVDSWSQFHPDWEVKLWNDQDLCELNMQNKDLFYKSNCYGYKSDLARYEILYRFGGLYVDTDFECLKSFDFLNCSYEFYVGLFPNQGIVGNSILASVSRHPILKNCIENIKSLPQIINGRESDISVQQVSGPQYLTRCVFDYVSKNKEDDKVMILPAGYFFGFPVTKSRDFWDNKMSLDEVYTYKRPESMAFHYWACSWIKFCGQ